MSQEDEFYGDLDKKTEKKSSCSLLTLAIFFTILFLILATFLIFLFKNLRSVKTNSTNNFPTDFISQIDYSKKEPIIEVPITSDELNGILRTGLGDKLSDPKAEINSSEILISGKLTSLFNVNISLKILPTVKDDKLYLKILQIRSWKFGLPGIVKAGLENSLNKIMDEKLSSFYQNYKVVDLQLKENQLTIFGKLK